MNTTEFAYMEKFPEGSQVKIADLPFLDNFLNTWKYHHKLEPHQLKYADKVATVKLVGFYHGGDILYELEGVPGTWHEQCLRATT